MAKARTREYEGIKDVETMSVEIHKSQRESNGNKLMKYKDSNGDIVSEDKVSLDIAVAREALIACTRRGRVDLNNIDEVIVRTEQYFEACEKSGTFPSMMGLSSKGFGLYRDYIQAWTGNHPQSQTTEYLKMVKEIMADTLTNASLRNHANVAQTIFQLKNHFEHQDEVKVTKVSNEDPLMIGAVTEEEIKERYKNSVVWED